MLQRVSQHRQGSKSNSCGGGGGVEQVLYHTHTQLLTRVTSLPIYHTSLLEPSSARQYTFKTETRNTMRTMNPEVISLNSLQIKERIPEHEK